MTSRQLRNQRREAERKARKLEYQQNRSSAAAAPAFAPVVEHLDDTSPVGATPASPAVKPNSGATGPRTPEGKAISCANSLKHGLASGRLIIPGEDREDFEALLNDLVAEHTPATPTEEMLVQQMAQSWWLMHRAIRIQNQAFLETWCDMKKLALFLRYQTTYERAFYRAFNSLKKLQKERLAAAREFVSQNRTTAPTPSVGARHAAPFQPATTAFEPASGQNGVDGSSRTASTYNS
jgi:hypothetical protein